LDINEVDGNNCNTIRIPEDTFINAFNHNAPQTETLYPWYALRVRSNYERVAASHLNARGFEEFSPKYSTQRQWSDRRRDVEQYLFPGYVFCRLNPSDRLPVLTVPGVVNLVGFGQGPVPIPENEIENVQKMIASGRLVGPWPFLEVGQTVLIERGPLAGIEGILQEVKGVLRLVVSIHILQRSVSTQVERNWVRPVKSSRVSSPASDKLRTDPASLKSA
jgi:transcription termination/antitermination protein NusG